MSFAGVTLDDCRSSCLLYRLFSFHQHEESQDFLLSREHAEWERDQASSGIRDRRKFGGKSDGENQQKTKKTNSENVFKDFFNVSQGVLFIPPCVSITKKVKR